MVPEFWEDSPWASVSPALPPMGCVLGEERLVGPDLEMRRTPALDGKARDGFTQQGRCCAWEEKRPVGDGGRDRRVSLEG